MIVAKTIPHLKGKVVGVFALELNIGCKMDSQ
jgi:hypothetical protein